MHYGQTSCTSKLLFVENNKHKIEYTKQVQEAVFYPHNRHVMKRLILGYGAHSPDSKLGQILFCSPHRSRNEMPPFPVRVRDLAPTPPFDGILLYNTGKEKVQGLSEQPAVQVLIIRPTRRVQAICAQHPRRRRSRPAWYVLDIRLVPLNCFNNLSAFLLALQVEGRPERFEPIDRSFSARCTQLEANWADRTIRLYS